MPPGAELHVTGVCKALDLLVKSRDSTDPRQRSQRRIEHLKQIVGGSPAMREALSVVVEATKTASTVLILADSSSQVLTDPIARVIHFFGPRSGERFLRVNCALADDSLLERALFGHEKGAFTGARRKTDGLFREADKGTLFLDHVDEMMSTSMQIKLLHALQERRVRRVGSSQEDAVDVRIVAAFYQAPRELIAAGRFREDLYGRLNVMAVKLPTSEARFDLLADQISQLLEQARKAAACGAS
jgi:transcriptional regulator of aroF, aroG, tyrA and aromatic amino acid transport